MSMSVRNRLMTATMALAPFLLSACGEQNNNPTGTNFEIAAVPALLYTALLAHRWFRARSYPRPGVPA